MFANLFSLFRRTSEPASSLEVESHASNSTAIPEARTDVVPLQSHGERVISPEPTPPSEPQLQAVTDNATPVVVASSLPTTLGAQSATVDNIAALEPVSLELPPLEAAALDTKIIIAEREISATNNTHITATENIAPDSDCAALENQSQGTEFWIKKGDFLAQQGDDEGAIASYGNALEGKPDCNETWCKQGALLFKLGRNQEAIASYDRALGINPNNPQALNNQGIAFRRLGQDKKALSNFQKTLKLKPKNPQAWLQQGWSLRRLGHHEEALDSFSKATEFNPKNSLVWSLQGMAFRQLNRHEEALASIHKALELNPKNPQFWYEQGITFRQLGRHEEALDSFNQALAIKPDFLAAQKNRSLVKKQLNR